MILRILAAYGVVSLASTVAVIVMTAAQSIRERRHALEPTPSTDRRYAPLN